MELVELLFLWAVLAAVLIIPRILLWACNR